MPSTRTLRMDFFAAQDHARRQTKKLVVYFILAVIGIIAAIYAVCAFLFSLDIPVGELVGIETQGQRVSSGYYDTGDRYGGTASSARSQSQAVGGGHRSAGSYSQAGDQGASVRWWNPQLLAMVSGVVLLVVLGASGFKVLQLRGGGGVVARSLGGRQLDPATRDPAERRLLNIVEEMALASGTPVPEVYLLEQEEGINAFAAGHSPHDAAIGVTRGCIETLNRDELQGVIAHEFSHILNGDMRLNVRLIGVLFGILVLAVLGEILMRSAFLSGGSRRNNKDNSGMILLVLGFAVMAIGMIGIFFGRLIQSAISRQREYLADASAVQFTRYPDGIANALIKIGQGGSRLHSEHAQETAHMFFANGLKHNLGGGFATHPPLPVRIRAIKPDWDGSFEVPRESRAERKAPPPPQVPGVIGTGAQGGVIGAGGVMAGAMLGGAGAMGAARTGARAQAAMAAIGTLATAHIVHAGGLHTQAREILGDAGSDPLAAKALVYGLMLGEDDAAALPAHLELLKGQVEAEVFEKIEPFAQKLAGRDELHLPLLELAMPALSKLGKEPLKIFAQQLETLAARDERLTFGELAIVALVRLKIARKVAAAAQAQGVVADAAQLADAFSVVLSAVLRADADKTAQTAPVAAKENAPATKDTTGKEDVTGNAPSKDTTPATEEDEQRTFTAAVVRAPLFAGLVSLRKQTDNQALLPALEKLSTAALALKKQILAAAAEAVLHDGHVSVREAEWLRLIAACLDCPMPPVAAH